jgi:hypothetical protein
MPQENKTKAERRQARAGRRPKAERREAKTAKDAPQEGKQAKGAKAAAQKKGRAGGKGKRGEVPAAPAEDAPLEERVEWRLARIEEAVAAQSERSEELLQRVSELLEPDSEGRDTA